MSSTEVNTITEDNRILLTSATRDDSFHDYQKEMRQRNVMSINKELLIHHMQVTNRLELGRGDEVEFNTWAFDVDDKPIEEGNPLHKLSEDYRILLTSSPTRDDSFHNFQKEMRQRNVMSISKELLVHHMQVANHLELGRGDEVEFKIWAFDVDGKPIEERNPLCRKSLSLQLLNEIVKESKSRFVRSKSMERNDDTKISSLGFLSGRSMQQRKPNVEKKIEASPSA